MSGNNYTRKFSSFSILIVSLRELQVDIAKKELETYIVKFSKNNDPNQKYLNFEEFSMLYKEITHTRNDLGKIFEVFAHSSRPSEDGKGVERYWKAKVGINKLFIHKIERKYFNTFIS